MRMTETAQIINNSIINFYKDLCILIKHLNNILKFSNGVLYSKVWNRSFKLSKECFLHSVEISKYYYFNDKTFHI